MSLQFGNIQTGMCVHFSKKKGAWGQVRSTEEAKRERTKVVLRKQSCRKE